MEPFAKIFLTNKPLTIFPKSSILDRGVHKIFRASANLHEKDLDLTKFFTSGNKLRY